MRAEQAIYTSLPRGGQAGYHVVSRSPGVSDGEARALASWSPSHGALLLDEANRVSINFHPLTARRYALSRSCEGRAEYSGRGGRQVYTHALILDLTDLEGARCGPLAVYREALALGHFFYRPDPDPILEPVTIGRCHRTTDCGRGAAILRNLGLGNLPDVGRKLADGEPVELRFGGDRTLLAEGLLDLVSEEVGPALSFSTSLRVSSARPFLLTLLG